MSCDSAVSPPRDDDVYISMKGRQDTLGAVKCRKYYAHGMMSQTAEMLKVCFLIQPTVTCLSTYMHLMCIEHILLMPTGYPNTVLFWHSINLLQKLLDSLKNVSTACSPRFIATYVCVSCSGLCLKHVNVHVQVTARKGVFVLGMFYPWIYMGMR